MATKTKCKHARLSREKVCYECGKLVDLSEKKHKYGAEKVVLDGITFDSKKEGQHYVNLKVRHIAGEISALQLQPVFRIELNGVLICTYIADFKYLDHLDRQVHTVDCKGMKTPIYRLKKKLMKAVWDIDIEEV